MELTLRELTILDDALYLAIIGNLNEARSIQDCSNHSDLEKIAASNALASTRTEHGHLRTKLRTEMQRLGFKGKV